MAPAPDATGFHQAQGFVPAGRGVTDAWLVTERGGGLEPGERFDLIGGLTIGHSAEADVRIDDRYASGVHARIFGRDGRTYIEDMNSTNGTLLNDATLRDEAELIDGDTVRIGDTEFRYEASEAHA